MCELVQGDVSAEVIDTDLEGIIAEGELLAAIAPNIVVKVPMIKEGIKAIKYFSGKGIRTNCTLVFSAGQDGIYDMVVDQTDGTALVYSDPNITSPVNDPYVVPVDSGGIDLPQIGEPLDVKGGPGTDPVNPGDPPNPDGVFDGGHYDNITNHDGVAG